MSTSFYDNLDKFSATIFNPLPSLTLKHVVKLGRRDKAGRREYFHKEVAYSSNSYNDRARLTNLNVGFHSYFFIEESNRDFNERDNIIIGYDNIFTFRRVFTRCLDWFYKITDIAAWNRGVLRIKDKYSNLMEEITLGNGKVVRFFPTILQLEDETYSEGIKMQLNSDWNEYTFPLDKFAQFADFIIHADLYQYGLAAISYIGRPPEGKFLFEMEDFGSKKTTPQANSTTSHGMVEYRQRQSNNINDL